ncbi:MAG: exodeoxyribonuclease VII small subunit [Anaerolineales bacterium]|nr:exodeoxyribonuclease VII small subunit [Anaerolineales bacterium]HUV27344.1 exodeoxyribonuclease VII small subunit [Anaerolineales bacterium]
MNPPKPSPEELVPVEQLSYEQALSELEAIVLDLESDQHALEEALAIFERGQALAQHCSQLLEQAELKIQELSGEELLDFDPS